MKIPKPITSLLLALLGGASAEAAAVPGPAPGDLFIGFRASGGTGGATSYLVKIGNDTSFTNAVGSGTTLSLGDLGADLSSVFGANWFARADLYWGVFGHRTSASSILYASKERPNPGTQSTAWPALDASGRNSTDSFVTAVVDGVGGYRGREATSHSTVATTQPNSSDTSSYFKEVATEGTTDFGSLSQWDSIEGNFGGGSKGTVLDLYRLSGSGVTYRGAFSITDGGVLSYLVVPEPSSGLLLAGSTLLLGASRRRRTTPAAR